MAADPALRPPPPPDPPAGSSPGPSPRPPAQAVRAGPGPGVPEQLSPLRLMRSRGRLRGVLALLGPAFVASVAYIDPGNFATNFAAGARFGYALAWVIVVANLMAMLVQYLSAKVGVATGRDLPELCRAYLPRPVTGGLWVQAELIAMATDLAEFVGAALGLNLLFHVPLRAAGPHDGGGGVRDPGPRPARLPPVRAGRLRPARHHLPGLRLRPRGGSPGPVRAGQRPGAGLRRPRWPAAGGRHHRGHRDAARGLPALRADQVPGGLRRRRRAP